MSLYWHNIVDMINCGVEEHCYAKESFDYFTAEPEVDGTYRLASKENNYMYVYSQQQPGNCSCVFLNHLSSVYLTNMEMMEEFFHHLKKLAKYSSHTTIMYVTNDRQGELINFFEKDKWEKIYTVRSTRTQNKIYYWVFDLTGD